MKDISCPVCQGSIEVRSSRGRKSNKPFIMLICPVNGRHFRAFITDQAFMKEVTERAGELS